MLASLGLLSLLQMCLLPGVVILYCLGIRRFIQVLLLAMPVSVTANYVLFGLLNALGARDQRSWLAVAGLEILVLAVAAWHNRRTTVQELLAPDSARVRQWTKDNLVRDHTDRGRTVVLLLFGFAIFVGYGVFAFYRPGLTTFCYFDDTLTWGRWAREWADDGAATLIRWYPQLGPVNRAVGYIILGNTEVHLFNKMAMPLFPLLIVAMLLDLELSYRDNRFLLAAGFVGWMYWQFGSVFLSSGYMDIPTAAMVLAAMYPLLLDTQVETRDTAKAVAVASIVSAGAVWTKQTGLFVIPALLAVWWWRWRKTGGRLSGTMVGMAVGITTLAAATFYLPQALKIVEGSDANNLGQLRGLSLREPWLQNSLVGSLYYYPQLAMLVGISVLLSCIGGKYRHLSVPLVLLSFVVWGSLFNYEIRNYFFAFPILALAMADGMLLLWSRIETVMSESLRPSAASASAVTALVVVVVTMIVIRIPDRVILNRQKHANLQQVCMGIPNDFILDVASFISPEAKIATFYWPATTIPEVRGRFVLVGPHNFLETVTAGDCRFLFVETSLFAADWRKDRERIMVLIDRARERGILRPVMTRHNATLYYYDPVTLLAEYDAAVQTKDDAGD